MYWDVEEVRPVGHRTLAVKFSDGLTGTLHISHSYCTGVFAPLMNDAVLDQAMILNGVVTWPNGLDLAPDTMYWEIKNSPNRFYAVGRREQTRQH